MNKHLIHLTSPALVLALMFLTAPATAQDPMHARVSFESGGAMVQGTADETWSYATVNTIVLPGDNLWADQGATIELEISGGTFLRMADGSKAEVLELSPNTTLRGWTGAFYVQRIARSTGDFLFITPACRIEVEKNSHVRVDVLDGGSTTVSVRWGHAVIRTDSGGAVNVSAGRRIFVDVGLLPSTPVSFDRSLEDPFDAWCRERAELLATGEQTVPKTVSAGYPVGMSDLGSYGNWVVVEERQYWRPTVVVDYVPYRRGYWSYVPAYGHVWVGDYPFCYVTSHYGRWIHHSRYGWMWTYSPGWSPAWVASVRYGDYFVWAPLNVYNRPVTYGDLHFTVDGYRFSLTASSYTRVTDLFYGPSYVSACYPGIVSRTRPAEVHIWNIYAPGATININNNWHRQAGPDRVRDYSPRRVIRGPDTIGPRMEAASTRIATLESGLGRRAFAPAAPAGARQAPTMVNQSAQGGRMRSVAIRNEATPLTSDVLARASGSGDAVRDARSVRSGSPVTVPRSADAQGADRSRAVVGGPLTQGPSGGAPDRTVSSAAPSAGASAPAMTRSAPRAESSASSSAPTTSEVRRGPRTIPPPATTTQTPSVSAPGRTPTHGAPPSRTVGGDTPSRAPSTTATPRWESPRTGGERAPSSGPVTVPRSTPPSVSAPSVRQAPSAPTVRSVPQTPAPSVRYAPSTPAPTVRQAPPTTSTPRYVRAAPSAPSVRSAPSVSAPSPVRAAPSAPSVRSAPSPSVGSFGPSRSTSVRAR